LLAKLCLLIGIVATGWLLWPASKCTKLLMDNVQLEGLTDDGEFHDWFYGRNDYQQDRRGDVNRVSGTSGFLGRFFGSAKVCYNQFPVQREAVWKQGGAGGGILLFFLFSYMGRLSWRRQVRKAAQRPGEDIRSKKGAKPASEVKAKRNKPTPSREIVPDEPMTFHTPSARPRPQTGPLDIDPNALRTGQHPSVTTGAKSDPENAAHAAFDRGLGVGNTYPPMGLSVDVNRGLARGPASLDAWDDDEDDVDALLASIGTEAPERDSAADDASAPRTDDLPEFDLPLPPPRDTSPLAVIGMRVAPAWSLSDNLEVACAVRNMTREAGRDIRLNIELILGDAQVRGLWPQPQPIDLFAGFDELVETGRAKIVVPRQAITTAMEDSLQDLTGAVSLRIVIEHLLTEFVGATRVVDALTIAFVGDDTVPIAPALIRLKGPDGRTIRAVVGTERPGLLRVEGIVPGEQIIEFDDRRPLLTADGSQSLRVKVATDGVMFLHEAEVPEDRVRRMVAVQPVVVYVAADADPTTADGTATQPFGSIGHAISAGEVERAGNPERPIEVRVQPANATPDERPGAVAAGWIPWWTGRPADTTRQWSHPASTRVEALPTLDKAIREDLLIEDLAHIRIVNATYAEAKERMARENVPVERLEPEIGTLPMAVLAPVAPGSREPYRVTLRRCKDVSIEGIQLHGCNGQSGIHIEDSYGVRIHRCWIEHFAGGPSDRSGVYGTGRAFQIEGSGNTRQPVEISWCDIGWNHAIRQGMEVRGAAAAVYKSYVKINHCYVHDNRASANPPDIVKDKESVIAGGASNHRARNTVV